MAPRHRPAIALVVSFICALCLSCGREAPVGEILVTSVPAGAAVLVDGAATGETTPASLLLGVGPHRIAVDLMGHLATPASRDVAVIAGAFATADFALDAPGRPGREFGPRRRRDPARRDRDRARHAAHLRRRGRRPSGGTAPGRLRRPPADPAGDRAGREHRRRRGDAGHRRRPVRRLDSCRRGHLPGRRRHRPDHALDLQPCRWASTS